MKAILTAVQDALIAVAGSGELLEEITEDRFYLTKADKGCALPCVVISNRNARSVPGAQGNNYNLKDFHVFVDLYYSMTPDTRANYEAAELLGDKVEQALMENDTLTGFTMDGTPLIIEDTGYFTAVLPAFGSDSRECYNISITTVIEHAIGGGEVW
jgi:hypothetical protein